MGSVGTTHVAANCRNHDLFGRAEILKDRDWGETKYTKYISPVYVCDI